MSGGRPRTAIGTYGEIYVMTRRDRCVAETRIRDADGRLRKVTDYLHRHASATRDLEPGRPGHLGRPGHRRPGPKQLGPDPGIGP